MNTTTSWIHRLREQLGRRQLIALAVVLGLGAAGAVAILGTGRGPSSAEGTHGDEHHDDHGKAHGESHGDDHAKPAPDAHGDPKPEAHGKSGGHDEPPAVITLNDAQLKAAGVTLETAGPGPLRSGIELPGEVKLNEDRTAHVVPRVTGVVEAVPATLGQQVRRGQVLAVLSSPAVSDQRATLAAAQQRLQLARATFEREQRLFDEKISPQQDVQQAEQALREAEINVANARQKLQAVGASTETGNLGRYEIRAPFDGTLVEKHITLGEQVREETIVFTLSDLRTVWVQIDVPAKDLPRVRLGETVAIRASGLEQAVTGRVAYVGPLIGEQTRTAQARVTLENPQSAWRPGLFVTAVVTTEEATAAVTVPAEALQTVDERTVVFVRSPAGFVAQPVRTGRADGQRVEILEGLNAGATVAARGSFVLKSEAGKASASHEH